MRRFKTKERDGEVFLFANLFELKLTRTRQVMIKNKDENLYNLVEGLESPKGMNFLEKQLFLEEIAAGVYRKILQNERTEKSPEDPVKNVRDEEETDDDNYEDN